MAISSPGIGSGLDVNNIVQQLVAIERQPIVQLQNSAGKLQTQISAFGRVQSTLSTLRDSANQLSKASNWQATAATSSDTSSLSATVTGTAQPGSYSISIDRLATAQTLSSGNLASTTATLGSGSLRIELGDFDSNPPVPKAGVTAIDITIDPAKSSLSDVRDQINAASAGVVASVVTDLSGSRLVLRSAQTGKENGFRMEVLADNGGTGPGLSSLAFDPSGGATAMNRTQQAGNAKVTIDGIAVESGTNTVDGILPGMTLTLRKPGTTAEVRVEPDTAALKKSIDDFVKNYNSTVQLLRTQTAYDATTKAAGPLQGDGASISMLSQLRNLFTGAGPAGGAFAGLADIGLTLNTDGTIKADDAKTNAALAKGSDLAKLFGNVDSAVPANQGFAVRLQGWLKSALDNDGTIDARTQSLQARVKNNQAAQDRLADRVARTEQRLRAQYSALDTKMGQLAGLSSYVSQQVTLLNNQKN